MGLLGLMGMLTASAGDDLPGSPRSPIAVLAQRAVANVAVARSGIAPELLLFCATRSARDEVVALKPGVLGTWSVVGERDGVSALMVSLDGGSHTIVGLHALDANGWPGSHTELTALLDTAPRVKMFWTSKIDAKAPTARERISEVWGIPVDDAYAPTELEGVVLGAGLSRFPEGFGHPGSGPWTLIRVDAPGAGFVAFALDGRLELLPRLGDPTTVMLGDALLKATR